MLCALGGRLPERESPSANKNEVPCLQRTVNTLRRARDDSLLLNYLTTDVIPDALQHSYGAALIDNAT